MLGPFLAAIQAVLQNVYADAPKHLAHGVADYFAEGGADRIEAVVVKFLAAVAAQNDSTALAFCTPELQKSMSAGGAPSAFAELRGHLTGMSGFDRIRSNFQKTSCDLAGTMQYEEGRSLNYSITLVRTDETLWHEWKIGRFRFGPIVAAAPSLSPADLAGITKAFLAPRAGKPKRDAQAARTRPLVPSPRQEIAVARPLQLGAAILAARRAAGLSQGELASKLKLSPSTLARLERGRGVPSAATLRLLGNATHHKPAIKFTS